ncbi:hypothetical protein BAVI_18017 [Neobacillus vireti LMG 21834]|uniref:Lipoprotein n=2 Tax=Neobacillus TaxID=2675232 RepID=A0AB94IK01_9BACI|nr:hypothetical protein BAVI_18017 [Neobacillus vireti LMG 21834]
MKRITTLLFFCFTIALIVAGCGSKLDNEKWALDKKHNPLPDYVMGSPEKVQQTYMMAAKYPEVVAQVPCYCGCGVSDGHKSNLDCFIGQFGNDKAVTEWDSMGVA